MVYSKKKANQGQNIVVCSFQRKEIQNNFLFRYLIYHYYYCYFRMINIKAAIIF